jgi:hypothetical protein
VPLQATTSAGKSASLFVVVAASRSCCPRASSLHTSMALSSRSVPPQSRAPLSSTNADFGKRCPYGPPCLLGEAHPCLLLMQLQAGALRASSFSVVLSNRSVPPQSRAPLAANNSDFDKRCPIWAAISAGRSTSLFVLVAASGSGPPSFELAHLHSLIKQICPPLKKGTYEL